MNNARVLMLISLLGAVITVGADLWPATEIVNRPLSDVQASVQRYYDINSKPKTGSELFLGRLSPFTNTLGEVGFRFTMCNCAWDPVCCDVFATTVTTNKTRITVSLQSGLNSTNMFRPAEGTPRYQQVVARTKRILNGAVDQLDAK